MYKNVDKNLIKEMQSYYDECKSTRKVAKKYSVTVYFVSKYLKIDTKVYSLPEEKHKANVKKVIEWRQRTKVKLVEYKGGKCERCGYDKCVQALEFHHLDPTEKDFTISGKSWSFNRLKKEVDKCIMVCSNCHVEIHHNIPQ